MPVVGAWARVESEDFELARQSLSLLEGVETFDLDDPGKIGLLIEADDLDSAHAVLTRDVPAARGVLCAWPVSVHLDEDADDPQRSSAR
ncbi:MAG: hypothetical protein GY716_06030 [bacterium]|nr:hypothetical protein [bacterium]